MQCAYVASRDSSADNNAACSAACMTSIARKHSYFPAELYDANSSVRLRPACQGRQPKRNMLQNSEMNSDIRKQILSWLVNIAAQLYSLCDHLLAQGAEALQLKKSSVR